MHGFLNVDKPSGITSYDVIRKLKRIFPSRTKLGHLGTLDPMATGVLPVAVGQATRIISVISDHTKVYRAEMTLGGTSDTDDAWGTITWTGHSDFTEESLREILPTFTGTIQQIPPMYAAVHHEGRRLYELARQGIEVDRPAREITIHELVLEGIKAANGLPVITFKVRCSSGTYVRSLCRDIGKQLGTGAFLSNLIRLQSGAFKLETARPLETILTAGENLVDYLLPLEYPLEDIPLYRLTSEAEDNALAHGATIRSDLEPGEHTWRVYRSDDRFGAIAHTVQENGTVYLKPLKVFNKN